MEPGEVIIALVSVVGGLAFAGFLFHGFFSLIRYWMDSRSRNKLAENGVVSRDEFTQYKVRVEKRLQTLEALVIDEDSGTSTGKLTEYPGEPEDWSGSTQTGTGESSGVLRNQLRGQ